METVKPHKGRISEWRIIKFGNAGAIVNGRFLDHERFATKRGHTSHIVKHDEATGEVETENSRYILVGEPEGAPIEYEDLIHQKYGAVLKALEDQGYKIIGPVENGLD